MKRLIRIFGLVFGLIFPILYAYGQENLVPNGSFENYVNCPNGTAQLSYTGNWVFVGASTDYYNACSPQGNMSVPSNIYGYQDGYDSSGYIGMIAYAVGDFQQENTYREPAGTYLTQALTIGEKYYLSFKAALTINTFESGGACNKLGAKLSTVGYSNSNPTPINNFAHVYTDSVITDTVNWAMISGSFIADSAYTFISIGNFFDSLNVQYVDFNGLWYTESAYYYIDDIRLSTDSNFVVSTKQSINFNSAQFSIYPNPVANYFYVNQTFAEPYELTIYNSIGQKLYEEKGITTCNKTINATSFTKGFLLVDIKTQSNTFQQKILKP